jgi:hypothetical protein
VCVCLCVCLICICIYMCVYIHTHTHTHTHTHLCIYSPTYSVEFSIELKQKLQKSQKRCNTHSPKRTISTLHACALGCAHVYSLALAMQQKKTFKHLKMYAFLTELDVDEIAYPHDCHESSATDLHVHTYQKAGHYDLPQICRARRGKRNLRPP